MSQTDTANVIPELAGGWNDGLAYDFFRFLKRPLQELGVQPRAHGPGRTHAHAHRDGPELQPGQRRTSRRPAQQRRVVQD